jgi:hypothetical protein
VLHLAQSEEAVVSSINGFGLASQDPQPVYVELRGPDGETWTYRDAEAPSRITGDAGAFCRVGAHRLVSHESDLIAEGRYAAAALRVLRNYAA